MSTRRGWPGLHVALAALLVSTVAGPAGLAAATAAETSDSDGVDLFPEISAPGHTATLLSEGSVLLIGAGSSGRAAYLWDPLTGRSEAAGILKERRDGHTATLLADGRVLVIGGRDAVVDAVVWDPATRSFSEPDDTPKWWRLDGHTATLLPDGRVLIVGGADYDTIAGAETWDPQTGTYSVSGGEEARRTGHTATLLPDGRVLIVGGWNDVDRFGAPLRDAVLWDPGSGAHSPAGALKHARSDHTATLLPDGRVLVVGGEDKSGTALAWAEVWDPQSRSFSPTGELSTPRSDHTATLLPDGRVLVVGGWLGPIGPLSSVEAWDPASDSFSAAGTLAEARYRHTATPLRDGRVLVVGGETAYDFAAEIWDPSQGTSVIQPAVTPRPTRLDIEVELGAMIEGASWEPYRKSPAGAAFDPFESGARAGVIFDDLPADVYPAIDYVALFRFENAEGLQGYWADRAEAAARQAPERADPCADGQPGRGTWEKGELLCYVSDSGAALLRWTDEETMTYGVANAKRGRANLKALHRQWQAALGGIVTGVQDGAAGKADFNAKEKVLLGGVPADIAATCVALRSQNPKGTVAAVRCRPTSSLVRTVTYYLMEMKAANRAFGAATDGYFGEDLDGFGLWRCEQGEPGWEPSIPYGSDACLFGGDGRAQLRIVGGATTGCTQLKVTGKWLREPVVYIAVEGVDDDLAALFESVGSGGGRLWRPFTQKEAPPSDMCPH